MVKSPNLGIWQLKEVESESVDGVELSSLSEEGDHKSDPLLSVDSPNITK